MGFLSTPVALVVSFGFLAVLLYKRVNLGITLNATAIVLAILSLSWSDIPNIIYDTTRDVLTISVTVATFGIMLLSELYKETGIINLLSESLSRMIKNPKIVLGVLPAVIGFLPVAGGALMSAPLVDREADKLALNSEKKAYVNLWFRHTIFPVYPLSQVLIIAAALSATTVFSLILRNLPVVAVMVIVGYTLGFWKVPSLKSNELREGKSQLDSNFKDFVRSFSPILVSIIVAVGLDIVFADFPKKGYDVLIAVTVGIIVLISVSKPSVQVFLKSMKTRGIYGITFAAYGAFLLGSVIRATGISAIFGNLVASGSVDNTVLLIIIPAVLGILTASALGGVLISIPILTGISGIMTLSPGMASLVYMSAYLGYVVSPTHLCFAFTARYFRCSLGKVYKYIIPSFIMTFMTVLLIYFLV